MCKVFSPDYGIYTYLFHKIQFLEKESTYFRLHCFIGFLMRIVKQVTDKILFYRHETLSHSKAIYSNYLSHIEKNLFLNSVAGF